MRLYLLILFVSLNAIAQTEFARAEKLLSEGRTDAAKTVLQAVVKQKPDHLAAIEKLGDIEAEAGNWNEALPFYSELKAHAPKNASYHYKYGGTLAMIAKESNKLKALGMISEIRDSFETAIALNNKHLEARWALIELNLQLPSIVGGSKSDAEAYAEELLAISAVDGHLAKGHIAEDYGDYVLAEKHYKNAVAVGGSKTTHQKLANLYTNKMKLPEKAKAVWEHYRKQEANKT